MAASVGPNYLAVNLQAILSIWLQMIRPTT